MTDQPSGRDAPKAADEAGLLGKIIVAVGDIFSIFIIASAAILIIEVLLRYGFNAPTIWAHETVIFLTAITFVFGGLYSTSTNKHIRVVLIYDQLSENTRRIFNIVISAISAFASGLFAWAGWLVLERALWRPNGEFRIESSGSAWNPPTPGLLKLFLFGVLIIICIQFVILAYNYGRKK